MLPQMRTMRACRICCRGNVLILGQDDRVTQWVAQQAAVGKAPAACSSIGFERDGELVAGVYFTDLTETNVFAHIASTAEMFPVDLLRACAAYVFVQLELRRVTFMLRDDNVRCRRLVEKLGAVHESTLLGAHANGDVLLYALWPQLSQPFRHLVESGRIEV